MNANRIPRAFLVLRLVFLGASIVLILVLLGGLVGSGSVTFAGYCWISSYILLAIVSPQAALLIVAAIVPVIGMTTKFIGMSLVPPSAAELMALCVLVGCAIRSLWSRRLGVDRVEAAAIVVASLAAASTAGMLPIVYAYTTSTMSLTREGVTAVVREYFIRSGEMRPVHAAALLIESAALFIIARRACRQEPFRVSLLRMLVAGATAAALINIIILGLGLLRGDTLGLTLLGTLSVLRINVHHSDFNAAGSFFVLFLSVAIGFARGRDRWWAWPAATILAAGVWLAGSRSAMAALVLSAIGAFVWIASRASQQSLRRLAFGGAIGTVVLGVAVVAFWPRAGANMALCPAFAYRLELWEAGVRMLGEHPVIGVGIGHFPLFSQRLRPLLEGGVPQGPENAHNNFLQVGGELGLPALVALVLWITFAIAPAFRRLRTNGAERLELALVAGLAAFLLTCLVGHPLLVSAVAFPFWLALAAVHSDVAAVRRRFVSPWLAGLAVVLLVTSIPSRAELFSREANLEHVGKGLSSWREDPNGFKYREASNCSGVFVPGNAAIVSLPVRLMDVHSAPLTLSFRIDDRIVDAFRIDSVEWTDFRVRLPAAPSPPRYRFLEFHVRGRDNDGCNVRRLLVGKAYALDGTGQRIL